MPIGLRNLVYIAAFGLAAVAVGIAFTQHELLRPVRVYESEGKKIPPEWSRHFWTGETQAEMRKTLGPATYNRAAKDVQIYAIRYPWGEKTMAIIGDYTGRPSLIVYSVRLKDRPLFGFGDAEIYGAYVGGKDTHASRPFRKYALIPNGPPAR